MKNKKLKKQIKQLKKQIKQYDELLLNCSNVVSTIGEQLKNNCDFWREQFKKN